MGPFVVSLFLGGKVFYQFGELEEQLIAVSSAGEGARFNYEFDQWTYRADTGIRIRLQRE